MTTPFLFLRPFFGFFLSPWLDRLKVTEVFQFSLSSPGFLLVFNDLFSPFPQPILWFDLLPFLERMAVEVFPKSGNPSPPSLPPYCGKEDFDSPPRPPFLLYPAVSFEGFPPSLVTL